MSILTTSGRVAIAQAMKNELWHLAWGTGDAAWDTTPQPESIASTELVAEIGRRTVSQISFCEADEEGEIELADGKYALRQTPTAYLYLRFTFDYADAAQADIRECGIFMGTAITTGLPPQQQYFTPDQIEDGGRLVVLERFDVVHRSATNREQFEYVLVI